MLVRQWLWPLRFSLICGAIALGVLTFTVLAQWAWARHRAPEAPLAHATAALEGDLAALARMQPRFFDPVRLALWIGDTLRDTAIAAATGAARTVMNVPGRSREYFTDPKIHRGEDAGGDFVREQIAGAGDQWGMVVVGTYLFAVRTAMAAAALPLVLLAAAVGAVDGLVARARRKACAGRESASLFHRAKFAVSFVAIMG
jgi:hypothetical protein